MCVCSLGCHAAMLAYLSVVCDTHALVAHGKGIVGHAILRSAATQCLHAF